MQTPFGLLNTNTFLPLRMTLWQQIAVALLASVVALLVTFVVRPLIPTGTLIPFTAAVAVAAYFAGVRGAVITAIVSYLFVDYFFVEPIGALLQARDSVTRMIAFLLLSVLVGALADSVRRSAMREQTMRTDLESVLGAATDGILVMDADLNVLYANHQAERLLGLLSPLVAGSSFLGRLTQDMQCCDEQDAVLTPEQLPFRKALATGTIAESVFGCGPKDGAIERWISVRAVPILDGQGAVSSLVAALTDYSARRTALKKAEEDFRRLATVMEVMVDAVIVTNQEGALTVFNSAAEKLIGRPAAELRSRKLTEIGKFEPVAAADLALAPALDSEAVGDRLPAGSWLRLDSGERVPISGSVLLMPEQAGRMFILRDRRDEALLERQRLRAEQRLRDMIDSIICQVALLDTEGKVLEYNGAQFFANGNAPRSIEELPFVRLVPSDPEATAPVAITEAFVRALAGEVSRFDCEVRQADAEVRSFDIQISPLYDDQQQVSHVAFSAVEITDRKSAQKMTSHLAALVSAQRQRLEDIIEGVPAIIWESSGRPGIHHRITFVNRYTEQLLGLSLEEWTGRSLPWYSIMHPDDADAALHEMQSRFDLAASEPGPPISFRVFTADGAWVYLEMRLGVIRDEQGKATGLRGIAVDVTPQKEAERRIGQLMNLVEVSRKRLQDTIDAVPAVVWEAVGPPDDQQMVFVSNFAEQLSGYTAQEWVEARNISRTMIVPEDVDQVMETVYDNYYREKTLPVQYRLRHKDGRVRWVEARMSIVRDANLQPMGVRGVTMDITELRTTEAELRRSNEELQQFAYVASHDLQEPLRMVTSYLQLIEQRYGDQLDEQAREFIGFAVGGAVRMKQLITDLLLYSRVQTNREEFKAVDLNVLVSNVLQNLHSMITDTKAEVLVDPLPTISGNATLLTQLFQNLLNNSLKFRSAEPPRIEVRVERAGPMWKLSIRDNGIGFEPRYANRIFVLFQRLHSQAKYSGTGIGLAICKKVVESHAGDIWVESEPGIGSTFYFTLPATQDGDTPHAE